MAEADPSTRPAASTVVPEPPNLPRKTAAFLAHRMLRGLYRTLRVTWKDDSGVLREGTGPVIFCTWHNRLALSMLVYHNHVRALRPNQRLAALVSASRDGGLLSLILKKFEVEPVRGSTSRRGRQALLESTTWVNRGHHIAITPDGPRGPCYTVQHGIISLAQITGAPIVPVSSWIRSKFRLKSWDRFQIPLPFSKCEIRIGPALLVPREADDNERAALQERLREEMMRLTTD